MRGITALIALTGVLAGGCHDPGAPGDETDVVWLTVGSDALPALEAHFGDRDVDLEVVDTAQGIAAIRIHASVIGELGKVMHEELNRCSGFRVHDSAKDARGALLVDYDAITRRKAFPGYTIDNSAVVNPLMAAVDDEHILEVISTMSGFINRFYDTPSGVASARWLAELWRGYALHRSDVTVELYEHAGWPQPSVILTVPGDTWPDEVVVLGGHLDSTGGWSTNDNTVAPGADDDASGIATLSEIIRVALDAGYRPARTVKFMGYAAEEVGLLGSSDIADEFDALGVNVVGVFQLDMTNYNNSTQQIMLISDYTNAAQNQFVGDLIDTYVGVSWGSNPCGYACSDHASWTNAGYPASFPFEAPMSAYNPYIHTANDDIAHSGGDAVHAAKFARLGSAYLAEMAKGVLDGSLSGDDPPLDPPL